MKSAFKTILKLFYLSSSLQHIYDFIIIKTGNKNLPSIKLFKLKHVFRLISRYYKLLSVKPDINKSFGSSAFSSNNYLNIP